MTDDIVARLRDCTCVPHGDICRESADEIERLRKEAFHLAANQCHAGYGGEYGHHRCREIDRLTAERDEARRMWCELMAANTAAHREQVANRHGWDCFKEDADD